MLMLMIIILFSPGNIKNYMSPQSLYQQKAIKNYQKFSAKDMKDQFIGRNVKEKVIIKTG